MFFLNKYFLAFTIIPLTELFILIYMSDIIGTPLTVLIVILTAIAGTLLIKNSGKEVMENLRKAMNMQGDITDAILDGAILIVSGVLLITPGFFTDIFGLLIHIPVFKDFIKKILVKKFKDKIHDMENNSASAMFYDFEVSADEFSNTGSDTKTIEAKNNQDDYYL